MASADTVNDLGNTPATEMATAGEAAGGAVSIAGVPAAKKKYRRYFTAVIIVVYIVRVVVVIVVVVIVAVIVVVVVLSYFTFLLW